MVVTRNRKCGTFSPCRRCTSCLPHWSCCFHPTPPHSAACSSLARGGAVAAKVQENAPATLFDASHASQNPSTTATTSMPPIYSGHKAEWKAGNTLANVAWSASPGKRKRALLGSNPPRNTRAEASKRRVRCGPASIPWVTPAPHLSEFQRRFGPCGPPTSDRSLILPISSVLCCSSIVCR